MCQYVNLTDQFMFGVRPVTPNVIMSVLYVDWDNLNFIWEDLKVPVLKCMCTKPNLTATFLHIDTSYSSLAAHRNVCGNPLLVQL